MKRCAAALLWLLWAVAASAQDFPAPLSPHVSDFADLLAAPDESALNARLADLRDTHGVELAVVTIRRRADYGPSDSIETFATGLFNAWGIGDSTRNNGIMVLIARDDQEMRIELGAGYPQDWDWQAQLVIDDYFLPSLRAGNFTRALNTGTDEAIARIAVPFTEGTAPVVEKINNLGRLFLVGVAMLLAFMLRQPITDAMVRFRACPSCGARKLTATRRIRVQPSYGERGEARHDIRCAACNHVERETTVLPSLAEKKANRGSFGGGKSSGGGASGKW